MSEKSVKLKVYQNVGEKTYIDSVEAESFDDFVLVSLENKDQEAIYYLQTQISGMFPDKKVILIPKSEDITFYGIEVDNDN